MKQYFLKNSRKYLALLAVIASSVLFYSCKKDNDGSNFSSPGNPVFNAINIDSGAAGTVLSITGTGLGDMRTVIFSNQNVPALITPTLNTDKSIIFNVPDTAYGGNQDILLTNSNGKSITVPFKVLAYANVSAVSPSQDFVTGSEITLTGINLLDVSEVKLTGTNDKATIVSQSQKKLVIKMPATTQSRATLDITNATGITKTTQEFVSVENARLVYGDALESGFQNWSWGTDNINFSNGANKVCGDYSLDAGWSGAWGGIQLGGGTIDLTGMNYMSFYVKGGAADQKYLVTLDWGPQKVITVPKEVWTYFRFKLSEFAPGVTQVNTFIVQIQGDPVTGNLWDDIMFFK